MATNYNEHEPPPAQDLGLSKPVVPFRAGGKQQVSRKRELTDSGSVGYVPRDRAAPYEPDTSMKRPRSRGRYMVPAI